MSGAQRPSGPRARDSLPGSPTSAEGLAAVVRLAAAAKAAGAAGGRGSPALRRGLSGLAPGSPPPAVQQAWRFSGAGGDADVEPRSPQLSPAASPTAAAHGAQPGTTARGRAPLAATAPTRTAPLRSQSAGRGREVAHRPTRVRSADPRGRGEHQHDEAPGDRGGEAAGNVAREAHLRHRASDGHILRERADSRGYNPPAAYHPSSPLRKAAPFKTLSSTNFGGRYRVGRYLGRGASATVWEASHSDTGVKVAVKTFDQGSKDRRQAAREARVLSQAHHPNILEVFEVVESGLHTHMVCEHIDGESLRAFTQRQSQRRLEDGLARRLYRQVVDGVNYLHERLVVHRDLKLENLLLDRAGEAVKIIDFGFATQVAGRDAKLRAFCGTPSYMAPEIVRGEPYSGFATDVWALGVVLFAILCGSLPFSGCTEMQLYAKIRRGVFPCPEALGEPARRLVKGSLRYDPPTRPSTSQVLRHPWLSIGAPGEFCSELATSSGSTTPGSSSLSYRASLQDTSTSPSWTAHGVHGPAAGGS